MVEVTFTLNGIDELKSKFEGIANGLQSFVSETVMQEGENMVNAMKADAPVRTGFLRDNIEITNSSDVAVQVASLAYYSIFVEMGTSKMEPEPFFIDNAYAGASDFAEKLSSYVRSLV